MTTKRTRKEEEREIDALEQRMLDMAVGQMGRIDRLYNIHHYAYDSRSAAEFLYDAGARA